jgi:hypothetical protein
MIQRERMLPPGFCISGPIMGTGKIASSYLTGRLTALGFFYLPFG